MSLLGVIMLGAIFTVISSLLGTVSKLSISDQHWDSDELYSSLQLIY